MIDSKQVHRATPPAEEERRAGSQARVNHVIAVRSGLDARRGGRTPMSDLPHKPVGGDDVHALAIDRLVAAAAERQRLRQRNDAARGTGREHGAMAALAAANERFAAREAWVKYIEHGY
jgi:hypothetical protein